jgi:hydroxymethylglutaryl-CoA reductase
VDTGIEPECPQVPVAPARNFAGLAALFGEGAEGKQRGEMGLLIGTAGTQIGQASMRIEEGGDGELGRLLA